VTNYRKKLIEVALPLKAINEAAAKEKSIRHGHPSTLHLWWARRPLAACRAVLFASLVDDPDSDPTYRRTNGSVDEDRAGMKRADLFNLIEELVLWENSNNPEVTRSARAEIARCVASRKVESKELIPDLEISSGHGQSPKVIVRDLIVKGHCRPQPMGLDKKSGRVRFSFDVSLLPPANVVDKFLAEYAPPVLDPFAGGGSIPLEAQRLGLRSYASDLNPVAVLINKALTEIPPKFSGRPPVNPESRGQASGKAKGKTSKILLERDWSGATGLAEDVRYYGRWMQEQAEKQVGHLYPKVNITKDLANNRPDLADHVGKSATVIARRIARTVPSPDPAYQGVHVPLLSTYVLNDKSGSEAYIKPTINRQRRQYTFEVVTGPLNEADSKAASEGTKMGRGKFRCLLSGQPIPPAFVKEQGLAHNFGECEIAVVAEVDGRRVYLPTTASSETVVENTEYLDDLLCPDISGYFNPPIYGYKTFGSLFSARQKATLNCFTSLVEAAREQSIKDGADVDYGDAIATYLALAVSRLSNRLNTFSIWHSGRQTVEQIFSEQGVPMAWDYAEANPFSGATGSWETAIDWIPRCLENSPCGLGEVSQRDAATLTAPSATFLLSTDPPYYSSITYADFADFFYGTLRKCLRRVYSELFSTLTCPKEAEAVAAWHRFDGDRDAASRHFTTKLLASIRATSKMASPDLPISIYYAFKQQDLESEDALVTAWESILDVVMSAGLCISNTWPMRTEQTSGRKSAKNSLASSIVIVGRARVDNSPLTTRKEFITALRRELPEALRNLQHGNIAPVDLAQSAIGPGMAVYTRYAKVIESDGSTMSVRNALGVINQVLDEVLAEQEGDFDPDTRWALAWFEQHGVEEGPFGVAEILSKAKNTAVNGLVDAGIVTARGGKVRLLRRDELNDSWDPASDKRLTAWETTQHLIRILETEGEAVAAQLVHRLGGLAETARELAYRLYSICERKKWADEALAYNGLVMAWPELFKLALSERSRPQESQQDLF